MLGQRQAQLAQAKQEHSQTQHDKAVPLSGAAVQPNTAQQAAPWLGPAMVQNCRCGATQSAFAVQSAQLPGSWQEPENHLQIRPEPHQPQSLGHRAAQLWHLAPACSQLSAAQCGTIQVFAQHCIAMFSGCLLLAERPVVPAWVDSQHLIYMSMSASNKGLAVCRLSLHDQALLCLCASCVSVAKPSAPEAHTDPGDLLLRRLQPTLLCFGSICPAFLPPLALLFLQASPSMGSLVEGVNQSI